MVSSHRVAVVAAVLAMLVFGAAGGLLGPLLTAIGREFGISLEITGLLLPFTFAGSALSVVIAGYLADRFGKRPLFLSVLAALALTYVAIAVSPTFAVVAVGCLLAGALGGALEGLCGAIIADIDPPHVDRNMMLVQLVFCVGAVAMLLLTSRMVNENGGDINWRMAYLVLAGVSVITWMIALSMRVPQPFQEESISLARAVRMARDPAVLLLAVSIALYVGSEMSLASWISPLLEKFHGYAPSTAMMGAVGFWLAMGVGRMISSQLCRRYPGGVLLRWHILGGVLAYAVLLLPGGGWRLWAGGALAGFTFSGAWPLIVSLGSARYPAYSGTVVSLLVASGTIGGLAFTSLPGFVLRHVSRTSEYVGIGVMAALFVVLAITVAAYGRVTRQRAPGAETRQEVA